MIFNANALKVLERRYLVRDEAGEVAETPDQLFERVAVAVSAADESYGANAEERAETKSVFLDELTQLRFLPNSPTLMNAGTEIGQLSACFVLPVEDSIEGIFRALEHMAMIHKSGGGTGFSFSRLRPKGDLVRTTTGIASGPVSFMRIFDVATDVVKQGGRRRGANMGILRADHPDIMEFIACKEDPNFLPNFNISVAVTDDFMNRVTNDQDFDLINPRDGSVTRTVKAKEIFDRITNSAWETGDPGLVFIDKINENNPTPQAGMIESTNPCGEQPLLANESCNLGSLNLVKFVKSGMIDWDALRRSTRIAVHFLDNVIESTYFPHENIRKMTLANRKIGLGVMGFAEALIMLNIPYDSQLALMTGGDIMKFISDEAIAKSVELADSRGSFPNFKGSLWEKRGLSKLRNATLTTVAPTGTISIIAGTSSGIEPLFAVSFERHILEGERLLEVNSIFERLAKEKGIYSVELMEKIARYGTVRAIDEVPRELKDIFVTAFDIEPEWHVMMQAEFQKHVDNAVSKTVNLPNDATPAAIGLIYKHAYDLDCKGITIYRYGSKTSQVLNLETKPADHEEIVAEAEFSGGCVSGECPF